MHGHEVKAHAQPGTGRKEVLTYMAVVLLVGSCWHLAAGSAAGLGRQVGGLLAALDGWMAKVLYQNEVASARCQGILHICRPFDALVDVANGT